MTLWSRNDVDSSVDRATWAQMRELCRRMQLKEWIRSFDGLGKEWLVIEWSVKGAERAIGVRGICKVYDLTSPRRSVEAFSVLLKQGGGSPIEFAGRVVPKPLQEYWLSCEESLNISEDSDLLDAFVSVVHGWAPRIEADDFL